MADITAAIAGLTARTIAFRLSLENERLSQMSRLSDKLKLAGGVAARQTVKIEARADGIIAQEAEIEKLTDESFSPHEAILSEAQKGLDSLKRELALLSNDPLQASGGSPEVEPAAATTFQEQGKL